MTPHDRPDDPLGVAVGPAPWLRTAAGAARRSGIARLAAATYVTYVFGVVTGPLTSRALGATGRGQAAVVLNVVTLATIVLSVSFGPAVGHALTNAKTTEERALGAAVRFAVLIAPVAVLAAAVFYFADVTQNISSSAQAAGAALILIAPLSPVVQALEFVLLSRGDLSRVAKIRFRSFCAYSLVIVALFALGHLTTAWFIGATAVQGVLALIMSIKAAGLRRSPGLQLGPLLRYGSRQLGGSLMGFANVRADQLVLAAFLGFSEIGIYTIAVTIAVLPLGLAHAVSVKTLSTSGTARDFLSNNAGEALRRVLLLTSIASAALALTAPLLLPLAYGREFETAVSVLFLLLPGTVALAGVWTASQLLTVLGRPGTQTLAQLTALVVNGLLLIVLLPRYGIRGAAVASAAAYWVQFAVMIRNLRRSGVVGRAIIPGRGDVVSLLRRFSHG